MRILILNQAFYPDVASTAQHATDLALKLAARGHEVTAIASRNGYDHAEARYPARDFVDGIRILRVSCTRFGKRAKWSRAIDFASFLFLCLLRTLTLPRQDLVIAMTTPPLLSVVAAVVTFLKGSKLLLWVMDLNPDEAIAAGWLREKAPVARLLSWLLSLSLRAADVIVVLDSFMRARLGPRCETESKLLILPPWSHDGAVRYDFAGATTFREQNGLTGKFVVMYSGNHSPCHPLDTLLEAAARLAPNPRLAFCFVGGGSEVAKVRRFAAERGLRNIRCLPYQPLERLSASLSAGDLHVVAMGDPFVGIVHPCKVYNVLTLGLPFLYIGPDPSHVTEMLPPGAREDWAFTLRHGDVDGAVQAIAESCRRGSRRSANAMQLARRFSQEVLVAQFVRIIESGVVRKEEKLEATYAAK